MTITWIGHSCFKIESNGFTLILDPYEDGYVLPGHEYGIYAVRGPRGIPNSLSEALEK